jgi:hypothetical protein
MTETRKRKQTRRRYSYRRKRTVRGGAEPVMEANEFTARYLMIVPTALDAIVYTGANLLAAPGWCVLCDSGDEKEFYKSMSRMGVNEYYMGIADNIEQLFNLDWCEIYTISPRIMEQYGNRFTKKMRLMDIKPSNTMLNGKLNRKKTIEIKRMENLMKSEGYNVAEPEQVADAPILSKFEDIVNAVRNSGENVVFMDESNISISKIMACLMLSKTIVYIPTTTIDDYANRLRQITNPNNKNAIEIRRLDFLFVDRRTIDRKGTTPMFNINPTQRYMYEIDITQPMLIRSHNYVIRKLFGLLKEFKDIKDVFLSGYQYLSRLRMGQLKRATTEKAASAQSGGDYMYDPDNIETYHNVDPLDVLYGISPLVSSGGAPKRRRRHFSYRRRERGEKLKRGRRRSSFRRRIKQRK